MSITLHLWLESCVTFKLLHEISIMCKCVILWNLQPIVKRGGFERRGDFEQFSSINLNSSISFILKNYELKLGMTSVQYVCYLQNIFEVFN